MKEKVIAIQKEIEEKLSNVTNLKELNDIRISYLSKKGPISLERY